MLFQSSTDGKFFSLLKGAAENINEAAVLFGEMIENLDRRTEYAERLKGLESTGDRYTYELVSLLNAAFVTPLEREDILALAQELDDVVDGIEAAASRMDIYRIGEANEHLRVFTKLLQDQAAEIVTFVSRLSSKNLMALREHTVRIKNLEKAADRELRSCLSELFTSEMEPIHLIKMKEIYEMLESTTDRAEDVADTLESVVAKNA